MKFKSVEETENAVRKIADEMNIEIIEIAPKISKNPSLTFFIDTEGGVDLDTCEKFHNAIDGVLDELDPSYGEAYTLNVSSPGIDRPLKTARDFER
ncbi:MAG: ribosome maturation factor RimP, partial [Clostridia bacterium]|nr:ribosome maturation factor RimP [Clostridia bacterium]